MNGLRFLVVDDSPTMRQLIGFALRSLPGAHVVEAQDGAEALRRLAAEEVDFVLTDINMPIMDGLKLVSLLRANPATSHLPILIISTEGAVEDRRRGLELGADGYLAKPIQPGALLEAVLAALDHRSSGPQPAP